MTVMIRRESCVVTEQSLHLELCPTVSLSTSQSQRFANINSFIFSQLVCYFSVTSTVLEYNSVFGEIHFMFAIGQSRQILFEIVLFVTGMAWWLNGRAPAS